MSGSRTRNFFNAEKSQVTLPSPRTPPSRKRERPQIQLRLLLRIQVETRLRVEPLVHAALTNAGGTIALVIDPNVAYSTYCIDNLPGLCTPPAANIWQKLT